MRQPVPRLTEADLSRVVDRDFTDPQTAKALLAKATESVSLRGKVAATKLSGGSIDMLRAHLRQAENDERDVIAAAEYRRYMHADSSVSSQTRDDAIAADWDEYQSWLGRGERG